MSYSLVPETILDINFGNIKWFISNSLKIFLTYCYLWDYFDINLVLIFTYS